jgi:hypothetical protein
MVPPAETDQLYPVMPDCVEYTFVVNPTQALAGPEIVGTGSGTTFIGITLGAAAAQPAADV